MSLLRNRLSRFTLLLFAYVCADTHAATTITIDDWTVLSTGNAFPERSVQVGDTMIWRWLESDLQNVVYHPSGSCSDDRAVTIQPLGAGPGSYTFTESDRSRSPMLFLSTVDSGCERGLQVLVNILPTSCSDESGNVACANATTQSPTPVPPSLTSSPTPKPATEAPTRQPTPSPVRPPTPSPTPRPPVPAPTVPPTPRPTTPPPVPAPVVPPTPRPTTRAPVQAPISPPTPRPTTRAPVSAPISPPTPRPTTRAPVSAPISSPTPRPTTRAPESAPTAPVTPRPTTRAPVSTPTAPVTPMPTTRAPASTPTAPVTPMPTTRAPVSAPIAPVTPKPTLRPSVPPEPTARPTPKPDSTTPSPSIQGATSVPSFSLEPTNNSTSIPVDGNVTLFDDDDDPPPEENEEEEELIGPPAQEIQGVVRFSLVVQDGIRESIPFEAYRSDLLEAVGLLAEQVKNGIKDLIDPRRSRTLEEEVQDMTVASDELKVSDITIMNVTMRGFTATPDQSSIGSFLGGDCPTQSGDAQFDRCEEITASVSLLVGSGFETPVVKEAFQNGLDMGVESGRLEFYTRTEFPDSLATILSGIVVDNMGEEGSSNDKGASGGDDNDPALIGIIVGIFFAIFLMLVVVVSIFYLSRQRAAAVDAMEVSALDAEKGQTGPPRIPPHIHTGGMDEQQGIFVDGTRISSPTRFTAHHYVVPPSREFSLPMSDVYLGDDNMSAMTGSVPASEDYMGNDNMSFMTGSVVRTPGDMMGNDDMSLMEADSVVMASEEDVVVSNGGNMNSIVPPSSVLPTEDAKVDGSTGSIEAPLVLPSKDEMGYDSMSYMEAPSVLPSDDVMGYDSMSYMEAPSVLPSGDVMGYDSLSYMEAPSVLPSEDGVMGYDTMSYMEPPSVLPSGDVMSLMSDSQDEFGMHFGLSTGSISTGTGPKS